MARKRLNPAELEKRKLERRAQKKLDRVAKKAEKQEVAKDFKVIKTKKGESQVIEIESTDKQAMLKMAELIEEGKAVRKGYSTGFFLYDVAAGVPTPGKKHDDSAAKGFDKVDKTPVKSTSTVADLVVIVKDTKESGGKINKRFIKLLVRGSQLKRNLRKEAVKTLLTEFKIK